MRLDECYVGDVRDGLRAMIAAGIRAQTCVTSPPYWGLRDYGTAEWEGGEDGCDHIAPPRGKRDPATSSKQLTNAGTLTYQHTGECPDCGARRIDRQIGLEPTIGEYVATTVEVFRLVRDVLADDGTLWLNLGDSYHNGDKGGYAKDRVTATDSMQVSNLGANFIGAPNRQPQAGLKPKDLCGIPWRVAFALQADGWWLRQDIIWSKPNPMPESVTDRCTKAHEYLFLLAKRERYYYDADGVKEDCTQDEFRPTFRGGAYVNNSTFDNDGDGGNGKVRGNVHRKPAGWDTGHREGRAPIVEYSEIESTKRNRRSVWTVTTQPYPDAHFATFPTALVEPCILAGSRPGDVVLDPFMGSGTVAQVAQSLGRRWIGCELNPSYVEMQKQRAAQLGFPLVPCA